MLTVLDQDIERRIISCIYGNNQGIRRIETTTNNRLVNILFVEIDEAGKQINKFSIDRFLSITVHDGTPLATIITCCKNNGIQAS